MDKGVNCSQLQNFLKFSFLKKRLFAPLYVSLAVLTALLLAQEGLSLVVNALKQRAVNKISQTSKIKHESESLLRAALEEKVALRDYLLNQNSELLIKYQSGQNTFLMSLHQLSRLLQSDPSQQDNLAALETFYAQWQSQFVQPVLEGSFNLETLAVQGSLDPLRATVDRILVYERGLLNEQHKRLKHLDQLNQFSLSLSGLSIGLIIFGSGLNFVLLRRRVVFPIQQLIEVGHAWKGGQLAVEINHASEDEIGHLATTLNGMARDILVRQKQMRQRNQQLEDLISTLSHDLRTPLLANRITLDAIAGGAFGSVNDVLRELLVEYREANDNLIKLVETLLDISRYEAGGSQILNREALDWEKICNRVIGWIQKSTQNKCSLPIHIESGMPIVYGDSIAIQRVLQNLVENAVRLSNPGQHVLTDVRIAGSKTVQIAVRDQGPGLKAQEVSRLFYRFSQGVGRQGRAGLGLYLCRQIIVAHGGKIWVESSPGKGATFLFTLPVHYAEGQKTLLKAQID